MHSIFLRLFLYLIALTAVLAAPVPERISDSELRDVTLDILEKTAVGSVTGVLAHNTAVGGRFTPKWGKQAGGVPGAGNVRGPRNWPLSFRTNSRANGRAMVAGGLAGATYGVFKNWGALRRAGADALEDAADIVAGGVAKVDENAAENIKERVGNIAAKVDGSTEGKVASKDGPADEQHEIKDS